jgi:hypothetical protein
MVTAKHMMAINSFIVSLIAECKQKQHCNEIVYNDIRDVNTLTCMLFSCQLDIQKEQSIQMKLWFMKGLNSL